MPAASSRACRPRRPLSRDRVVRAAIDLVDRVGAGELSMRRLGAELGVEAMSLYRYFPSKRELLEGVVDELYGEVELPHDDDTWQAALVRFAHSWRAMAQRHPRALPLLMTAGRTNPGVVRARSAVQGALRRAGFDEETTFQAECTLVGYTMGLTTLMLGEEAFALGDEGTDAPTRAPRPPRDVDADFAFGLDAVIQGLDASTRDRTRPSSPPRTHHDAHP